MNPSNQDLGPKAPVSLAEIPTQFTLDGQRYILGAMPQPRVATRAVGVFDPDPAHPTQPPVFVKWASGPSDSALLRWEWTVLGERLPAEAPVSRPLGWIELGSFVGIVLPFQQGPTLERASRARSLSVGEIMGLAAALCEAAEPLAAQGWQHHDLKPENVLITPAGLLLVDLESASSALESPPGGPRTSPRYQPPERDFSLSRDVYSIGVMLMDLLAARLGRSFAITAVGLWEALDMAMATQTSSDGATLDLIARALDRDPSRRPTCRALGEAAASLRDVLDGPSGAALMERLAPGLAALSPPQTTHCASPPPTLWAQNPLLTDLPGARTMSALKIAETVTIPLLPLAALLAFCVLSIVLGVEWGRVYDQSVASLVVLSLAVPLICNAVQRAKEASQCGEEGGWLIPQAEPCVWTQLSRRTSPDKFIAVAIGLCFGVATASAASHGAAKAHLLQWALLAWGQALVSWLCLKPLRVLALINETFAHAPDRWLWADERRRRLVSVFVRRLLASIVLAQGATILWALVNLRPLLDGAQSPAARLLTLLWGGFVLSIGLGPLLFTMAGFRLYLHRLEDELHNPGPTTARFNFLSRREWWSLAAVQAAVVLAVAWGMTRPAEANPATSRPAVTQGVQVECVCEHPGPLACAATLDVFPGVLDVVGAASAAKEQIVAPIDQASELRPLRRDGDAVGVEGSPKAPAIPPSSLPSPRVSQTKGGAPHVDPAAASQGVPPAPEGGPLRRIWTNLWNDDDKKSNEAAVITDNAAPEKKKRGKRDNR